MKLAYYARPISVDDSPQETRDHDLIRAIGYEPYPVGEAKEKILALYKTAGMLAFKASVEDSNLLIFRAFPDGSIGAGVAQEIGWAIDAGIPVVEFPRQVARRTLSVDETREMLKELGQR